MKILIVEDEPVIRKSLATIIERLRPDYEIIGEAREGQEALNIIYAKRPDVVFTDIRMPGISGLELAKELSIQYPMIKVVILSGYADFEYARAAIESRVVSYLLKPIKIKELKATLEAISESLSEEERESVPPEPADANDGKAENRAIVKQIMNIVENHYSENVSQAAVAEMVSLSPNYMSTLFHKETGKKYSAYVAEVKMRHAERLMVERPQLRIYEIAQICGYENVKHFMKVFSKAYSMTPSQYRETHYRDPK